MILEDLAMKFFEKQVYYCELKDIVDYAKGNKTENAINKINELKSFLLENVEFYDTEDGLIILTRLIVEVLVRIIDKNCSKNGIDLNDVDFMGYHIIF